MKRSKVFPLSDDVRTNDTMTLIHSLSLADSELSDGSRASSHAPSIHVTRQYSVTAATNHAFQPHDEGVDHFMAEEFIRRNSSFETSGLSLLTVPSPKVNKRRHSVGATTVASYGPSLMPHDRLSLPRQSLVPPMSPGGMSMRSNWSELIRLADRQDSEDSITSYQSYHPEPIRNTMSGISHAIGERLSELVSKFSSRTERFKERAIQPPTPSSDSHETSASTLPLQRHRLSSFLPGHSLASGATSTMEPFFVETKCCKTKMPAFLKYLNPARTIDPTGKVYLLWLMLVTLAFMYNATVIPLRACFIQAEFFHKEIIETTICNDSDEVVVNSTSEWPTVANEITQDPLGTIFDERIINETHDEFETTPSSSFTTGNCYTHVTEKTRYYPPVETNENRLYWWFFDYLSDFVYLIDILLVKVRVHFVKNGLTEKGRKECLKNYIKSNLFKYDALSLIPLDIFYIIPSVDYNVLLRFPRFLKVFTFWEFYDRMDRVVSNSHIIRVFRTLMYMLFLIHIESCGYYLASAYEGLGMNLWVYSGNGIAYVRCMYLASKTATSIGNNPIPTNMLEWCFMTLYWLSGVFVFAMLIGQIRDIFQAANAAKTSYRDTMDKTMSYMNHVNVPDKIQNKVRSWFTYNWEHQKTLNENSLVETLPTKMKADLAIHVHFEILSKVQLFQDCDKMLLFDLVLKLQPILYLPQDYICKKGEVGTEMYIVMQGQVEVVGGATNDIVFATLYQGSVFGEISLLALAGGNRRTANVRSKGYSQLFILSKTDFEEAMADYPEAQKILKKKAKKLLNKTDKQEATVREDETIIKNKEETPKLLKTVVSAIPANSKIHQYLGTKSSYNLKQTIEHEQLQLPYNQDEEEEEDILVVEQIERPISEAELTAIAERGNRPIKVQEDPRILIPIASAPCLTDGHELRNQITSPRQRLSALSCHDDALRSKNKERESRFRNALGTFSRHKVSPYTDGADVENSVVIRVQNCSFVDEQSTQKTKIINENNEMTENTETGAVTDRSHVNSAFQDDAV